MAFLRNTWYVAMWSEQLAIGDVVSRTICDEPVAIFRKGDGGIAAIADQCSHRFAPLSKGNLCDDSTKLECAYHGLQFDETGHCVHNPHGSGRIPQTLHVRAFPVVERHSIVWIWMGERAANPDLIPDFSHLDDGAPGIVSKRDMMVIDVDYRLMVDNLLDLSELPSRRTAR
jgi:phenylpropionate dioxygenase-like ring-hydroxylating dioxygenase large terminal subunit